MAEMLVRTVDKINEDSEKKNSQCFKRGMVVAICPDDHPWSEEERTATCWAIVKVPGSEVDDLTVFLIREDPVKFPDVGIPPRTNKLDLDALVLEEGATEIVLAFGDVSTLQVTVPLPESQLVL